MEKATEHPMVFPKSINCKLSVKEQFLRFKGSKGSIIEAENDICEEINAKFQEYLLLKTDTPYPAWVGRENSGIIDEVVL